MFRERMEMEPLSFENVDLHEINHQIALESRFNVDFKSNEGEKQTSISDFV
jgi:hypothetical protein